MRTAAAAAAAADNDSKMFGDKIYIQAATANCYALMHDSNSRLLSKHAANDADAHCRRWTPTAADGERFY